MNPVPIESIEFFRFLVESKPGIHQDQDGMNPKSLVTTGRNHANASALLILQHSNDTLFMKALPSTPASVYMVMVVSLTTSYITHIAL